MNKDSRILVTGAGGMVGKHLVNALTARGYTSIFPTYHSPNLLEKYAVKTTFTIIEPEYVFHLAAKVGSIYWNKQAPAEFIHDNILINANVIEAAKVAKVKKLLFCGSSAMYPQDCPQPMKEEYLMTGKLEETSSYYSFSKLAGLLMCQAYRKQYGCNFITCLPTNLYGPHDKFDERAHVIPSLIDRFWRVKKHDSPIIIGNGMGTASRGFLYVEDFVEAMILLMECYDSPEPINVGGECITIKELMEMISRIVEYPGNIVWTPDFPEGVKERSLDNSKIHGLGWVPKVTLEEGIKLTYDWYKHGKD